MIEEICLNYRLHSDAIFSWLLLKIVVIFLCSCLALGPDEQGEIASPSPL